MQNHTTIIGVLDLRAMGARTATACRAKYGIGNSTVRLIESHHKKTGCCASHFFVAVTSDYFVGWRRKRADFA